MAAPYASVLVLGVVWLLLGALPILVYAEQFTGKVVGISDGDTLSVLREGKAVKVRLHSVDTPEKAQAFGTQARKLTGDLVFQQTVTVVIRDTDRYGRLVGDVLLPDGRSLNQELVKAGMAWWYRQYAPNDTTLAQLEAEARTAKRGLWADATPVAPWEWRRGTTGARADTHTSPRLLAWLKARWRAMPTAKSTIGLDVQGTTRSQHITAWRSPAERPPSRPGIDPRRIVRSLATMEGDSSRQRSQESRPHV